MNLFYIAVPDIKLLIAEASISKNKDTASCMTQLPAKWLDNKWGCTHPCAPLLDSPG